MMVQRLADEVFDCSMPPQRDEQLSSLPQHIKLRFTMTTFDHKQPHRNFFDIHKEYFVDLHPGIADLGRES